MLLALEHCYKCIYCLTMIIINICNNIPTLWNKYLCLQWFESVPTEWPLLFGLVCWDFIFLFCTEILCKLSLWYLIFLSTNVLTVKPHLYCHVKDWFIYKLKNHWPPDENIYVNSCFIRLCENRLDKLQDCVVKNTV